MPWILALLGIGALALLLAPKVQEHQVQQMLREMGIEPEMMAMWAAQRAADQRLDIAQTLVTTAQPASARQLEAASQANQQAARRTAEVANAIDRFVKSGRTHTALSTAYDEVAHSNRRVTSREQDLDMLRKSLPQAPGQRPGGPSAPPPHR